jgi:hypothetical protein
MRPTFQDPGVSSSQQDQRIIQQSFPLQQHNIPSHGQYQLPIVYSASIPTPSGSIVSGKGQQQHATPDRSRTTQDDYQHRPIARNYELEASTVEKEPSAVAEELRTPHTTAKASVPMSGKKRSASTEERPMMKGKKQSSAGRSKSPGKYSEQVKKGLAASSRTNQACDRCKVRQCNTSVLPCTLMPHLRLLTLRFA